VNKDDRPRIVTFLALAVCLLLPVSSFAQQYIAPDYPPPADIKEWLVATEHQRLIPPGTTITPANWQQFKEEMSYGLQTLYSGRYF
jgi:Spy/CpxP family protein refolding chaperone